MQVLLTTQNLICFPEHFKESLTKEGTEYRTFITLVLSLHLSFFLFAFFFLGLFLLALRQLFYAYLAYYIYLTLSRLVSVVYLVVVAVGVAFGCLEMLGVGVEGAIGFFSYLGMNAMQAYGCYIIGRKLMKYTYSLQRPQSKKILEVSSEYHSDSYESASSSNEEDEEKKPITMKEIGSKVKETVMEAALKKALEKQIKEVRERLEQPSVMPSDAKR